VRDTPESYTPLPSDHMGRQRKKRNERYQIVPRNKYKSTNPKLSKSSLLDCSSPL
jgi:hypothetical protein